MSGTCANTLLPIIRVRRFSLCPQVSRRELGSPKKTSPARAHPFPTATLATFAAGSIPEDRYPPFYEVLQEGNRRYLRPSTTKLSAPNPNRSGYLWPCTFSQCFSQEIGIGREIKIIGENVFGAFEFLELHQGSNFFADKDVESG